MARLKPVLQSEASECGLACLCVIACAHGHKLDLPAMRELVGARSRGMTGVHLGQAARLLHLDTQAVRIEVEELALISTPAVLHWGLTHFVVLERMGKRGAWVIDPAVGRVWVSQQELDQHFTGVAFEFRPNDEFRPITLRKKASLSRLWRGGERVTKQLTGLFALSALLEIIALSSPLIIQAVTDAALPHSNIGTLGLLAAGLAIAVVGQSVGASLRGLYLELFRAQLNVRAAGMLFRHLLSLPAQFFQVRHVGDIQSRFASLASIHGSLSGVLVSALLDACASIVLIVVMAYYSVAATAATLLFVAAYMCLRLAMHRPTLAAHEQMLHANARRETYLLESLRGAQSIKAYAQTHSRAEGYDQHLFGSAATSVRVARYTALFQLIGNILLGGSLVATVWVGALLVLNQSLSIGMFVALILFRAHLVSRVVAAFDAMMQIRMLDLHVQRVSDISESEPAATAVAHHPGDCNPSDRGIHVREVSFSYPGSTECVLDAFSMRVREGESLALVGASGCGKSTVAKLMAGLLLPDSGAVWINGQVVGGEQAIEREEIAFVAQDDIIFGGSVAQNVAMSADSIDIDAVEAACRRACVWEDIAALPLGPHSHVGDNGSLLSGGQRQRVLIARALYSQPRILILDEATSHLDALTERALMESLSTLRATRVHIAHRSETIAFCDRVVDMSANNTVRVEQEAIRC